ncbi:helix-turn-helix transcriptional regulator [Streptomyces bambusae]|uniref:helix-turn-helix domain-containing protein n=1 Tax=Streptomyces bambusae TaxID=1550616 RepID=UPI001CFE0BD6|nr:helix-turn-helix transcriptional regulator [Streptomyces bambusae]MCB5167686.1 helix-turn-helix transcriptional regulator [Streptomyces bambusae]
MADYIGQRIAARRRSRRKTQADLARESHVSLAMVKGIERGARRPSPALLEALASALGADASRLDPAYAGTHRRVHAALPRISEAIAGYEIALDRPSRPAAELRSAVAEAMGWRLDAQYGRIVATAPALLTDSLAHLHAESGPGRTEAVRLVVDTARAADAAAYKFGAHDLSARLIDVMRWAAAQTGEPDVVATTAYVQAETFLAVHAYRAGRVALERALDGTPGQAAAVRGALHMRTAVVAARGGDAAAAATHLGEAAQLANRVVEGVYRGTAFGPSSVRIHEVAVAVSLGRDHTGRALDVAREWKPGDDIPVERRSGFYIEVGRAQLWAGFPDAAFESLRVARRLAPQHVREHPWAREDIETMRRIKRADAEALTSFAAWIGAV